ncbi:MAG: ATP-binding cassette domain-containing protein [Gemmatimonadales bacterium]|nr:ATP-binding cassette domain-containing protein [Gemmatimonadales bacterium]NIN12567.1 ATP-binding cassette domain-containing protein [Gemmatimonadales bacterium]NIR03562.1 ATP-binding cassette domain-containing protein [Gemmatimonadales bacterium]NIS65884.1 ATP-binding cassette domain-containing protein [Gemmatimonadales bacterium]
MLVNRLAGLVLPGSSKFLIDDVIGEGQGNLLIPLAAAVGIATLVQAGTSFSLSQVLGVAAQRAITDMRKSVQAHVTRLPIRYFDSTKTGVLISRIMTDAEGIRNLVGTGLVRLSGGLVTAAIALAVLIFLNWKLTALILLVLSVFGAVMTVAFNRLRPLFRERGKINAEVTGRLTESLGGIRVVKAYVAERSEHLVFARGAHRLFRNIAKSITGISAVTAFTTVIIGAIGVVMIVVGGQAIIAESMTLGDFVMYVFFTGLVAMPLVEIAEIGTQISEAFAGLDRIREIRRMATEDDEDPSRRALVEIEGDVGFEDVTFAYHAGVPVLKGVSFRALPGTTTALVGPSGSGKSTLISLVMAFNKPASGKVTLDGQDLTSVRLRDYRSRLGVVLQENFLFDGTITENISYARPHASPEEIRAVARLAHADEFIEQFEQGYETIVGERGIKLSGGQRQRIAIARAILADPKILILDEATSSLDSESEALIQDGLRSLRRGRTTFVIAHRLSTIRSADQILVLDAGEIVERGTHEELLANGGLYRRLYDKQYRLEHDRFVNPGEDPVPESPDVVREARRVGVRVPRDL